MQGDDVQAEIDGFTRQIRERIVSQLLQTPGVNLLWRPSIQPWRHHRSLGDVQCGPIGNTRYYIGLDIQHRVGGGVQLSARALDPRQGTWVSGFGLTWQGALTDAEQQALAEILTDEYLRGLRPLPLSEDQADRVAAYLARNLSCLLQDRGAGVVGLYTQPVSDELPFLAVTMELLTNYLSRFKEVWITVDPAQANYLLSGEMYALGRGLHQLWINVGDRQSGRRLRGTDTDVYVRLDRPRPSAPGAEAVATGPVAQSLGRNLGYGAKSAPRPVPYTVPVWYEPSMVIVPGGLFEMGSESGRRRERPVHIVRVRGFELGRYEVTRGQFRAFVEATGYRTEAERDRGGKAGCYLYGYSSKGVEDFGWKSGRSWRNPGFSQGDHDPVVCVSWNDEHQVRCCALQLADVGFGPLLTSCLPRLTLSMGFRALAVIG